MAGKRKYPLKAILPRLLGTCAALALLLGPEAPALAPIQRGVTATPDAAQAEGPAVSILPAAVSTANAATPEEDAVEEALPVTPPDPEPSLQKPVEDAYFDDVLFLGDSRTEGLSLYGGPANAAYLFAVGATVESVFTKPVERPDGEKCPLLDTLAEQDCGKVYIMLGVNELGWPLAETYRDQYAKVIERVRADHPEATVVLQSILPVSAAQDAKGTYVNNDRIRVYNDLARDLAAETGCPWLDIAGAVADETGCLSDGLTFDGVHLNPAGCALWLDYLRTHPV